MNFLIDSAKTGKADVIVNFSNYLDYFNTALAKEFPTYAEFEKIRSSNLNLKNGNTAQGGHIAGTASFDKIGMPDTHITFTIATLYTQISPNQANSRLSSKIRVFDGKKDKYVIKNEFRADTTENRKLFLIESLEMLKFELYGTYRLIFPKMANEVKQVVEQVFKNYKGKLIFTDICMN